MEKFKLMQIIPSLKSGGVEQGSIDVANYLSSLKFKNYLCSNGGPMLSFINKQYIEHFKLPAIKLNNVVFPDPLGPIIPVIVPCLIFKEQLDTAAKPPKYLDKFSICKIFSFFFIKIYLLNLL